MANNTIIEAYPLIFKPGARVPEMICFLLNMGIRPIGLLQEFMMTPEMVAQLYPGITKKPFFWTEFVPYMTSGPCFLAIFQGYKPEKLLGAVGPETEPRNNEAKTLRYIYGEDQMRNGVHCPKTLTEATMQLEVFKEHNIIL